MNNAAKETVSSKFGKERPLSPHLTVYRPQITTMLSIMHRLAGVFNLLGSFIITWWLVSVACGPEAFSKTTECLTSTIGMLFLVAYTLSLSYHFSNGIRHLFWDAGYGYKIPTVTKSGILVLISAIALTSVIWINILRLV